MSEMLALSAHLPRQTFEPGAVVVREGETAGAIWVLVSGALLVRKGDVVVNTITRPGAVIGEVSALLGTAYSATVQASERSVLHHAADAQALLDSHPAITRLVAVGLAERLNFVTTYLADLKMQYADVPGLNMVSAVLRELSERQASARDPAQRAIPNPEY